MLSSYLVQTHEHKDVLTPTVKRERKPYTPETAATKIQATYHAWVLHRQYKKHCTYLFGFAVLFELAVSCGLDADLIAVFRAKVVRELVTTEHTYVESLEKMLQVC